MHSAKVCELGCVCNVSFESDCRIIVELAIPCEKPGSRVFEGFAVGYHPRSWEIVYNSMTQYGYEKAYKDYMSCPLSNFDTDQSRISLYMTAVASLPQLVQKPTVTVYSCQTARDDPYEVQLTIPPVEGYNPIQFSLTKMCESEQNEAGTSSKGWALFGIFSCIFFVISTLFCCGGFIYKTQVQRQASMLFTLSLKRFFRICMFSPELLFNKSSME
ncbi:hypothetical protein Hanom_Chr00s006639g01735121 [Helianthus anomalus]